MPSFLCLGYGHRKLYLPGCVGRLAHPVHLPALGEQGSWVEGQRFPI